MPDPIMHDHLPPEVSSDWHQIIAKALYARLVRAGAIPDGGTIILTQAECETACDAEFEYGLDGENMLFRPAADTSIPGEHPEPSERDPWDPIRGRYG